MLLAPLSFAIAQTDSVRRYLVTWEQVGVVREVGSGEPRAGDEDRTVGVAGFSIRFVASDLPGERVLELVIDSVTHRTTGDLAEAGEELDAMRREQNPARYRDLRGMVLRIPMSAGRPDWTRWSLPEDMSGHVHAHRFARWVAALFPPSPPSGALPGSRWTDSSRGVRPRIDTGVAFADGTKMSHSYAWLVESVLPDGSWKLRATVIPPTGPPSELNFGLSDGSQRHSVSVDSIAGSVTTTVALGAPAREVISEVDTRTTSRLFVGDETFVTHVTVRFVERIELVRYEILTGSDSRD